MNQNDIEWWNASASGSGTLHRNDSSITTTKFEKRVFLKRILSFAICLCLAGTVFHMSAIAVETESGDITDALAKAEELQQLGLFRGVGTTADGSVDFDLERTPSRLESLVMLIRLLGKETEAEACTEPCPFSDVPEWGKPYATYAYKTGLTVGAGDGKLGMDDTTASMYLTFVLRALGYDDSIGDFVWNDNLAFAKSAGILSDHVDTENFRRADMVTVSYYALRATFKNDAQTLAERLIEQGVFTHAEFYGKQRLGTYAATLSTVDDLDKVLIDLHTQWSMTAELTVPTDMVESFRSEIAELYDTADMIMSAVVQEEASTLHIPDFTTLHYNVLYRDGLEILPYHMGYENDLDSESMELYAKSVQILSEIITPDMSDYDKVKAIHDYLVLQVEYGRGSSGGQSAQSALFDRKCLCGGYANAFKVLCGLSGIPCIYVKGLAGGVSHAWNKVLIDGTWYLVDVTWDDLNGLHDKLRYNYFLVSDTVMGTDHIWDDDFLPTCPTDHPADHKNMGGWKLDAVPLAYTDPMSGFVWVQTSAVRNSWSLFVKGGWELYTFSFDSDIDGITAIAEALKEYRENGLDLYDGYEPSDQRDSDKTPGGAKDDNIAYIPIG